MSQEFPNQPPQQPYNQQPQYNMPPPGYQQPMMQQPPKKKAKWPFVVGGCGVLAVLAICGIIATSAGIFNAASKGAVSDNTSASTDGASQPTNTSTIAKVGQTVTVDSVSCTLVSVKALAPDEFNKPKAGYQFIVVHLTMKNMSSSQVSYNPLDFHVKSSTGNVTDTDFTTPDSYTANNALNSGNLDPNGTVSGDIIFQAPVNDAKAELTWAASIFANNTQYGWTLGKY